MLNLLILYGYEKRTENGTNIMRNYCECIVFVCYVYSNLLPTYVVIYGREIFENSILCAIIIWTWHCYILLF